MQERRNEVAAITLQLYVGGRRNAGQIVFIHTAALRGSLGAELKQQGPAATETETAITPIWTCPFRHPQALSGGVGEGGTTPTGGSILGINLQMRIYSTSCGRLK